MKTFIPEFEYAGYIWSAYGVTALALVVFLLWVLCRAWRVKRQLAYLETQANISKQQHSKEGD